MEGSGRSLITVAKDKGKLTNETVKNGEVRFGSRSSKYEGGGDREKIRGTWVHWDLKTQKMETPAEGHKLTWRRMKCMEWVWRSERLKSGGCQDGMRKRKVDWGNKDQEYRLPLDEKRRNKGQEKGVKSDKSKRKRNGNSWDRLPSSLVVSLSFLLCCFLPFDSLPYNLFPLKQESNSFSQGLTSEEGRVCNHSRISSSSPFRNLTVHLH